MTGGPHRTDRHHTGAGFYRTEEDQNKGLIDLAIKFPVRNPCIPGGNAQRLSAKRQFDSRIEPVPALRRGSLPARRPAPARSATAGRCCGRSRPPGRPDGPRSRPARPATAAAADPPGHRRRPASSGQRSRGRISGIRSCTAASPPSAAVVSTLQVSGPLGAPGRPDAREGERRAVGRGHVVRLLLLAVAHPLEPAVGRHQAAATGERGGEGRRGGHRLGPRVDHAGAGPQVVGPRRQEAPAGGVEHPGVAWRGDTRTTGTGSVGATFQLGPSPSVTSTASKRCAEVGFAPRRRVPPAHGATVRPRRVPGCGNAPRNCRPAGRMAPVTAQLRPWIAPTATGPSPPRCGCPAPSR